MVLEDFSIGLEFLTALGRWRCTDIGTRTIIAIQIDKVDVIRYNSVEKTRTKRVVTDDPSWFNGPPYAVAECVFDEDEMIGCFIESVVNERESK